MLDLGLRATVNSDDPAYFGGYLNDNYDAMATALNLDMDDIITLAKNSFRGSFLGEDAIEQSLQRVDDYVSGFEQKIK